MGANETAELMPDWILMQGASYGGVFTKDQLVVIESGVF